MADRCPSDVKEIMRSTWSWACRPRDRCPRLAIYTPGYPAVEEGPSLLGDLLRRPPVVPDGHRAHPSVRNQMSCHAVCPFPYRVKKESAFFFLFFSFRTRGDQPIDDFIDALVGWYREMCHVSAAFWSLSMNPQFRSLTTRPWILFLLSFIFLFISLKW